MVNSLGMQFVSVSGTRVLFSVWETRVRDYELFVKNVGPAPLLLDLVASRKRSHSWKDPGFRQTPEDPVVCVRWLEAKAFCEWLTLRERQKGLIRETESYRLPKDQEWSRACALPRESGETPALRDSKVARVYAWGSSWPPPRGAANLAGDEVTKKQGWRGTQIEDWSDDWVRTAPVGHHAANRFGMFDLDGNVSEWCDDRFDANGTAKTIRGAAWCHGDENSSLASRRFHLQPWESDDYIGFRCVFVPAQEAAGSRASVRDETAAERPRSADGTTQ